MNGLTLVGIAIVVLVLAYLLYGRWLVKTWGIDETARTPAYRFEDGQDYVPASRFTVFSHQFNSITGAGPVTGPIIAAMFGWLPAFLWLLVGGVFFGAVQDFTALYASVKNDGKSMGLIIERYIGKTGRKLFLLFCWLFTLLVIAAFADILAGTFNGFTKDGGQNVPGAAAASISMIYIFAAMVFGLFLKFTKTGELPKFILGVVLVVAMLWAGIANPLYYDGATWRNVVFAYRVGASYVASQAPERLPERVSSSGNDFRRSNRDHSCEPRNPDAYVCRVDGQESAPLPDTVYHYSLRSSLRLPQPGIFGHVLKVHCERARHAHRRLRRNAG